MAKKIKKRPENIKRDAGIFRIPYGEFQGRKVSSVPCSQLRILVSNRGHRADLQTYYSSLYQTIVDWLELNKGKPETSGEPKREIEKPVRVSHNEVKLEASDISG